MLQLKQTDGIHVFLSHNSKDKPIVRELAQALRKYQIQAWLYEEQLIEGRPWQEALETIINEVSSAAVLIGSEGLWPWEEPEMRACLNKFVQKKCLLFLFCFQMHLLSLNYLCSLKILLGLNYEED